MNDQTRRQPFGRLTVLAVTLAVGGLLWFRLSTGPFGWDFGTYSAAVDAWLDGANPYRPDVLAAYGRRGLFVYLPVWLPVLGVATLVVDSSVGLVVLYTGLLCLAWVSLSWAVDDGGGVSDHSWILAVLLAGFGGGYWGLLSGNAAVPLCAVFASSVYAANRGRWGLSGAALGVVGSVKLLPLVLGGVYLLLDEPTEARLRGVGGFLAVPVTGVVVSALAFPELFPAAFLRAARSTDGGFSLFGDGTVTNHPTLYALQEVAELVGMPPVVGVGLYGLVVGLVAVGFLSWAQTTGSDERIALAMVAYLVVVPRLKPYALVFAAPAVVLVAGRRAALDVERRVLTAVTLGFPTAVHGVYALVGRPAVRAAPSAVTVLLQYAPTLALLVWVVYWFPWRAAGPPSVGGLRG